MFPEKTQDTSSLTEEPNNKVIQPVEPEVPETPEQPPTLGVKTEEVPGESVPPGDDDPNAPKIPRARLNEELEKRHQAEMKTALLEKEVEMIRQKAYQQPQAVREQTFNELKRQFPGFADKTDEELDAIIGLTNMMTNARTTQALQGLNSYKIDMQKQAVLSNNSHAKQYSTEIDKEIESMSEAEKNQPSVYLKATERVLGRKAMSGELVRSVQEDQKKKLETKKQIVRSGQVATQTGDITTKKKVQLDEEGQKIKKETNWSEDQIENFQTEHKIVIDNLTSQEPTFGGKK